MDKVVENASGRGGYSQRRHVNERWIRLCGNPEDLIRAIHERGISGLTVISIIAVSTTRDWNSLAARQIKKTF